MPPRPLVLGRLVVHGDDLDFEPADTEFPVAAGEEVAISIDFSYEEASSHKEALRLLFSVEADGHGLGTSEARIGDRPLVHDRSDGTLGRTLVAPRDGVARGTYIVAASYSQGPWMGQGERAETMFHHEGRFTLRVIWE